MQVTITPMRTEDIPTVAELAGQLGYPSTAAQVERRFGAIVDRADSCVLVARSSSGQVLGWVHVFGNYLLESDAHAEIGGLVVADAARGQHVGAVLLAAAEEWAFTQGYRTVRVRSNVTRERAHRFYQRAGYVQVKTQHNFLKELDKREPASLCGDGPEQCKTPRG